MKLQDKMSADQLWVRSHSYYDVFAAPQTSGQHFPIYNAANFEERNEMAMRSIARRFDWDLEKFRNSKKPADKGNRRRLLKNLSKFGKNPFGYVFWRVVRVKYRTHFWVVLFWISSFGALQNYIMDSWNKDRFQDWRESLGEKPSKGPFQATSAEPGQLGIGMMPMTHWSYTRTNPEDIVVNPTYRQNYRLYFDRQPFAG